MQPTNAFSSRDSDTGISDSKIHNLIDLLMRQYQHVIGEQHDKNISSEKIIEDIVNYYEDIINCMPGNVYWLDKNGVAVGCNKNVLDMLALSSLTQFKGLTFEDMGRIGRWSQEAEAAFKNDTLAVIRTGEPKINIEDVAIPHANGTTLNFLTSRVPLFDRARKVIGVVGISIDISELKQTQAQLKLAKDQAESASQAKSEFIANMSHDIKTPLSGMIGLSELLTYRLADDDLKLAKSLLVSCKQLMSFFDSCLEIFKLENNDIALVTEWFNLRQLINEIYELFQPAIAVKGLTFHLQYQDTIPALVFASRASLYRILLNLVGNAVKFTHRGSVSIDIKLADSLEDGQANIAISVTDSGIGIPEDKHDVIFDRFTRLIPSYKGTYEGNGIGLYIVNKFVSAMRGTIEVNSIEGNGSQFKLNLPFTVMPDTSTSHNMTQAHEALPSSTHNLYASSTRLAVEPHNTRILLVEDNETARMMESMLLKSLCKTVDVLQSGEQVIERFIPGQYELIFMDIGLPGLQGDAVTRHIRQVESASHHSPVPIIGLTAQTTDDIILHCQAAGMQEVISKPLSLERARALIERYSILPVAEN